MMFSAYHREGYIASMEAEVEVFMSYGGIDATSVSARDILCAFLNIQLNTREKEPLVPRLTSRRKSD